MTPRPLRALGLILILSVPIYVWGVFYPIKGLPFGLPGTAVMIVIPALVASLMMLQESGRAAVTALWRRVFDIERVNSPGWMALAFLTMPAATSVAYFAMQAVGLPLPPNPTIDIAALPVAFIAYFAGAALEEVGWTGYCTEPLQARFGVPVAAMIIGGVWAAWHLIPWIVIQGHTASWAVGETALTVLMRVVMGYIYARGGKSLFLATLFHATINVSYSLFPNGGSHYDPTVVAIVLMIGLLAAAFAARRAR